MRKVLLLTALLALAPAAHAKPVKLTKGEAVLEFDLAFGVKLVQAGVNPQPIAPATSEATTYTFPVRSGTANGRGTRARIRHRGGQSLTEESEYVTRTIRNLTANFRGGRVVLYADAGGNVPGAKGLAFLKGKATSAKTKRGLVITVKKLRLTAPAAADTNAQFGTSAFSTGEVVGKATFSARK